MTVIRTFCKHFRTRNVRIAAERAVSYWLPEAREESFRMNLLQLCKAKGIRVELERDSMFEGRFVPNCNGASVITLRDNDFRDHRKACEVRFTFAHELGHWVIHKTIGSRRMSLFKAPLLTDSHECQEEHLADSIASEILMPCEAMKQFARKRCDHDVIDGGISTFKVLAPLFMRRFSECSKRRIVSITVLPLRFKDPQSGVFVDDAWLTDPGKAPRRCRNSVRILDAVSHEDIGMFAAEGLNVQLEHESLRVSMDCRYRLGVVPRATLVGELPKLKHN